jgi:hypothetical protein
LTQHYQLNFNQLQFPAAAWYFFPRVSFKKAAAVKNLHLNESGGVLNEKRDHF